MMMTRCYSRCYELRKKKKRFNAIYRAIFIRAPNDLLQVAIVVVYMRQNDV